MINNLFLVFTSNLILTLLIICLLFIIVDLCSHFGAKRTYQDVKSGVIKHHTRGSLDIVTFDNNKQIIPFTSKDLTLYKMNKERLEGIKNGLIQDGLLDIFKDTIKNSHEILDKNKDIFTCHNNVRELLWKEMQRHPLYNRSISFTFIEHQNLFIPTDKYNAYKNKFIFILGDKWYDPNSPQHRKEIFNAMLCSFREIDPDVSKKFHHFKEINVKIDQEFLQVLSQLIRQTLI